MTRTDTSLHSKIDTHGLTPVVLKPKKSLQENLTLSPPGPRPWSSAQVLIVYKNVLIKCC
jgi:hypothetical protein